MNSDLLHGVELCWGVTCRSRDDVEVSQKLIARSDPLHSVELCFRLTC